ncbi:hypothetical protein E3O06_07395 [Cryobacterium glaciale]|uniref:Uncharacterized protein n=1 Tax=Cryobacterium glaciale TaxID=1259145 RepID=A0A4R8V065_9MICO|nr:hypothetical protein [Cryobacterium glaciale]TFB74131.1 hypothetical protein E3O06_07395 [Cryobacterium glaciale]
MPAAVLAERLAWTGSITWFREHFLSTNFSPLDGFRRHGVLSGSSPKERLQAKSYEGAQREKKFLPKL